MMDFIKGLKQALSSVNKSCLCGVQLVIQLVPLVTVQIWINALLAQLKAIQIGVNLHSAQNAGVCLV